MSKKIIIGPGYPLRGGISESNQALYNAFKYNMEDVSIISYSLQYPKILFPGKKQFMDNINHDVDGVKHLINTLNPLSWLKTARHIIQEKPQYVIVRYWHPYFAFCLSVICNILHKQSIFVIAWIDNIYPHESMPFQKFLTSYFLDSCDAFFVMSNSVKRDLLNYIDGDNKKIYLSPHPVYNVFGDLVKKQKARQVIGVPSSDLNNKYILFFGLIRKYKGLDLLLDVMASSKVQQLNINLIIAGEFYDDKDKYINKINHLKIKNRIFLYDSYIPNQDVANYFCAADLIVQPYLSATQSGVSMIAYNFNKPIILTNVGGLSEYVQHQKDGYLVDVNVDSIVEALVDFYQNNREDSFAKAVKQKQVNYNWSNFAKKFNSLYDESDYS